MSWFPLPVPGSRADRPLKFVLKFIAAAVLVVGGCASPPPAPVSTPTPVVMADPEQPARNAEAIGDYGAAAHAWQALAGGSPSPGREAYQLRAAAAWLAAGNAASSQALLAQIDVAPLGDELIARKQILLARLALGREDPTAAAAALAPTRQLNLPPDLGAQRDALFQQLPPQARTATADLPLTDGDFLAVLLPYGGSLDSAAQAITAGIVAARLQDSSGPELRFYASGDDVLATYRQALADGAAAFIGPLQKAEVATLAQAPLPRPTLALNNPEPPAGQVNLYRLSLDPADEAAAGVGWLAAAGYRDVAMLYADDAWGRRQRDLYRAALTEQGGRLVGAVPFLAGDTDFSAALRGLFSERLAAAAPASPDMPRAAPPTIPGPQALIVISSAADARQIVPQLGYVGVFGLPVLTTSQVWSGSPDPADADIENVVFCDSPWALNRQALSGDGGPLAVARLAWPQLDREPPRLVALGTDAYAVGRELRLGRTVDAVPDGLTGALGMDTDGALHRRVLSCARFQGGVPALLTPGGSP